MPFKVFYCNWRLRWAYARLVLGVGSVGTQYSVLMLNVRIQSCLEVTYPWMAGIRNICLPSMDFKVESDAIKNQQRPNPLQEHVMRLYVCIIVHLYRSMIDMLRKKKDHLEDEEISHAAEADTLCMQRMLCPMKMPISQNANAK